MYGQISLLFDLLSPGEIQIKDYKRIMPCMLHEGVEMMRRLSLSVVGAFFTSNSTVAVALAMIISVFFFGYHCHYYPYRDPACNRLHTLCLSILNFIYFSGLLLKTQTVEQSDKVTTTE